MTTYYIPIAGTNGSDDPWVVDQSAPFARMMREHGFTRVRRADGTPVFEWNGRLNGLWGTGTKDWESAAVTLATVLLCLPYAWRNLIAHSHGGQVALLAVPHLMVEGQRIRTLTTVGTPRRKDIDAERFIHGIDYWQHIYDERIDAIATLRRLGQIGDWSFSLERRFLIDGVVNLPVKGIGHSDVFHKPEAIALWQSQGWLDNIRDDVERPDAA